MNLKYLSIIFLLILSLRVSVGLGNESKFLFFTDNSCPYCKWWEKDISKVYPKTEFSKIFKLIRISYNRKFDYQSLGLKAPVSGVPTFVLVFKGNEIGRIQGYNGPEMFWWQVEDIVESLNRD